MPTETSLGWHFLPADGCMRYGDGRKVVARRWYRCEGAVVACENGMHHSERILDALRYAPGPVLCRTELRGELAPHGNPVDKLAGRERKVLWKLTAAQGEQLLRYCARKWALDVVHLWAATDVVLEYLLTGRDDLRESARESAARESASVSAVWESASVSAVWASAMVSAVWASAMESQNDDLERFALLVHAGKPLPALRLSEQARAKYQHFKLKEATDG